MRETVAGLPPPCRENLPNARGLFKLPGTKIRAVQGVVDHIAGGKVGGKVSDTLFPDESGEDYLYHRDYFLFVDFPPSVTKKILALQCAT